MHTIEDVREHLDFAHSLGLVTGRLYSKMDSVRTYHAIYASPRDEIRPVLGRWGVEAYDFRSDAMQRKRELEQRGLETNVVEWDAYGNEECKITTAMLRSSRTRFAYLIFHEGFHIHVRRKHWRVSPQIEEALCDAFAYKASKEFHGSNGHMQAVLSADFSSWMQYYDFVNKWLCALQHDYAIDEQKGRNTLERAAKSAKRLEHKVEGPVNNAFFLRLSYYAPKTELVATALKDFSAKDILDKEKLYAALRPIKK